MRKQQTIKSISNLYHSQSTLINFVRRQVVGICGTLMLLLSVSFNYTQLITLESWCIFLFYCRNLIAIIFICFKMLYKKGFLFDICKEI